MNKKLPHTNKKRLYDCASKQQGFFTTKLAEQSGFHRSHHSYHVKVGHWIREMRGIYRLSNFPQNDEDAQLILWYLWSRNRDEDPQGVYSHDTALRIYELGDLMPSKLSMTVPKKFHRFNKTPNILVLHKADLAKRDIQLIRGFAVTTPARTLLDIIKSKHLESSLIKQAYKEALRRGLLSPNDENKISEFFNEI
ncbi:MAG: hypothetical protein OXB88_10015 [Bacteriovoracales bacterium]|nr:hypothetical protein [Bacteriovoracales bacterium]